MICVVICVVICDGRMFGMRTMVDMERHSEVFVFVFTAVDLNLWGANEAVCVHDSVFVIHDRANWRNV